MRDEAEAFGAKEKNGNGGKGSRSRRSSRPAPPDQPGWFNQRVEQIYYFSIQSQLSVRKPEKLGVGPSGARLHVVYDANGSKVWTDPAKLALNGPEDKDPFRWRELEGQIQSGGDFVLARLDGVLELDGRITIRTQTQSLIDAAYEGVVDLASCIPGQPDSVTEGIELTDDRDAGNKAGPIPARSVRPHDRPPVRVKSAEVSRVLQQRESNVFRSFLDKRIPEVTDKPVDVPVVLRVSFEAASTPATNEPGEDLSWVKKRYREHEVNFWRYRRLVRKSFVAIGSLQFRAPGPDGICSTEFDIFELRVKR